jgi:hypothetical protein
VLSAIILYLKKVNIKFGNSAPFCTFDPGELAEWSIAAVLKTVDLLKGPGVRIPNSPHFGNQKAVKGRKIKFYGLFCLLELSKQTK